jgi:hypothetical protein
MSDSIFLLQPDSSLVEVTQAPYALEHDLQKLLDRHPELLPGAQISPEEPRRWLVVRSEAGVPNEGGGSEWWSLDHLLVDQDGVPTFVEVKRSSDTRVRREVVAQMLEYAANGTAYWRMETLRAWFEESERLAERDPQTTVQDFIGDAVLDADEFWSRVEENLQAGRVRCIFVADAIPATLRRLVEFLNEHLDTVEVLAVELPQYVSADNDFRAVVPRLVGQTERARAAKGTPARATHQWDEESFMAEVGDRVDSEDVAVCGAILQCFREHADRIDWGRGARDGSLIAVVQGAGVGQVPFTMWTYGSVEIDFQYLKNHPPFADESLRRELLQRLNAVPGVQLPSDSFSRRPSIPLRSLRQDERLRQFLSVFEWAITLIREADH